MDRVSTYPRHRFPSVLAAGLWAFALFFAPHSAAAHEDFPSEWCGGEDCRYAEDGELNVTCDGVEVEAREVRWLVPVRQLSVWNGEKPAICARNRKLNLCNPNKGDCSEKEGLGLLIPEEEIGELRAEIRAACRRRSVEAIRRGQSVPGLKAPRGSLPPMTPPVFARRGPDGEDPEDLPPELGPEPPESEERQVVAMAPAPPIALTAERSDMSPIPLPPAALLLVAGAAAIGFASRRKQ